jgi:hypothetical protein
VHALPSVARLTHPWPDSSEKKKVLKLGDIVCSVVKLRRLGDMASPLGGTVWPHHGRCVPLLGGAARRTTPNQPHHSTQPCHSVEPGAYPDEVAEHEPSRNGRADIEHGMSSSSQRCLVPEGIFFSEDDSIPYVSKLVNTRTAK